MSWHAVVKTDEVPEGEVLGLSVGGQLIAFYQIEGKFFATANVCTHSFALLSDGYLDGDCIECPIHQALFHVPSGEVRAGPATDPLATFPVKVDGDMLMVELPAAD